MKLTIPNVILFLLWTAIGAGAKDLYLIITSDAMAGSSSLQRLIEYRSKEFDVRSIKGSSIGTTKDDYRTYVRTLHPAYVLFVGKYGDFPSHYIDYTKYVESYNYYVASSLTGHPKPDIPLGLFFVESEFELANIVQKTVVTDSLWSSQPKKVYFHAGSTAPLEPWPLEFNREILTEMNDTYFEPHGYSSSFADANDATPNDSTIDIETINSGIRYMLYHGHGLIPKWSYGMSVKQITQLTNSVYPIILSFSCLTGSFSNKIDAIHAPCFAQKMVASTNGPAAYLGSYNTAGRGMNPLMNGICKEIGNPSCTRLGDAVISGINNSTLPATFLKYYDVMTEEERTRTAWQFHIFGDPALRINRSETGSTAPVAVITANRVTVSGNQILISTDGIRTIELFGLNGRMLNSSGLRARSFSDN